MEQRVILISGASGGLGGAVVDAFLSSGAQVAAVARSHTGAPRERLHLISADLLTEAGARHAVAQAFAIDGRIDALVHLMGGFRGGAAIAATDDETWNAMFEMNATAAFRLCRAALPHMLEQKRGRILAVGSRSGVTPGAGVGAYAVSKAALHALIETIAAEVKDSGVTANAVLPSVIDTPANRAANPGADYSAWVSPARIAELLVWLASDAAADVNGALLPIYGRA
jgi:NAD(P)-dependent dehydrogenase (short-subunit alcohol dehydrogenase family)